LWPGATALVATVWSSAEALGPAGLTALSAGIVHEAIRQLDDAAERAAGTMAEEGTRLAADVGLVATPITRRETGNVWATLDNLGEEHDVAAVVVGSRGRSELHAFLLGSVTHGLVHHSRRPVVVVRDGDEE
jgi:nucleotide-binding universal stress UspA family protein